jgi:hypothetical protein
VSFRSAAVLLALLGIATLRCDSDPFGPDLGPIVGPELDGVRLEVTTPRDVSQGEEIPFQVTLRNVGASQYAFVGFPFDVYVLDGRGGVVWNFFFGGVDIGADPTVIEPGAAYEFELHWNQHRNGGGIVPAGTYLVFALFYPSFPPALVSDLRTITI